MFYCIEPTRVNPGGIYVYDLFLGFNDDVIFYAGYAERPFMIQGSPCRVGLADPTPFAISIYHVHV